MDNISINVNYEKQYPFTSFKQVCVTWYPAIDM